VPDPLCEPCTNDSDCDDGQACTADSCADGACDFAEIGCESDGSCFRAFCDTAEGCVQEPLDCGDGDPCTEDSCDSEELCVHTPVVGCTGCASAAACQDGDPCTVDACVAGACSHAPVVCPAGDDPCTVSVCEPDQGCKPAPTCDDGDACTDDLCEGGACAFTPVVCTGDPLCLPAVCDPTAGCAWQAPCDDGDPCTLDTCDATSGACQSELIPSCAP
jgi:hypothetical protein